jgi:DNA repair photolyase
MPDCWTINPYRGCSFGCRYCYARYTHEFLGLEDPEAFERRIFVKVGAASALEREATEEKLRARPIAIGTVTDPYQPAESRYRLTRGVLEVLARYRALRISLTTKSALVVRDIDLLRAIAARSKLAIHVSLITTDRALARRLDPGAPSPSRRLASVRALAAAGIDVGVNAMPILPAINDGEDDLRRLFVAARESGAGWIVAVPLFLASQSRRHFFSWLRREEPERVALYRRLYGSGIEVDSSWRRELAERIARIRRATGVPAPPRDAGGPHRDSLQLALPGIASDV